MNPAPFLKGVAIGLSIAAPVGPIGILCIRRTLKDGRWTGFTAGMGAATADAAYGGVAAFGLTSVSGFLIRQEFWLGMIGGAFLCYLGIRTFLNRPASDPAPERGDSLLAVFGSTLFLTLANPATILSFVVVFAALGLGASVGYLSAGWMVLGVFLGSALWWLALSTVVSLGRSLVTASSMRTINRVSGAVLFAFGIYAFAHT
jgi:threonine/homoserine/homoserine lactone efflux protein